jgi:hypothetical protein
VFFARVDNLAARAHQRLLADDVNLVGEAKSAWSRFIMTLMYRTPEGVERITRRMAAMLPETLVEARRNYPMTRRDTDPPTFDEFRGGLSDEDAVQAATVMALQRLMDSERIGTALNRMAWAVIRTSHSSPPLLTSDRPIITSNGLGNPGAFLILPISFDRIFIAANSMDTIERFHAQGNDFVSKVDTMVVRQARAFVYCTDESRVSFVSEYLGERLAIPPYDQHADFHQLPAIDDWLAIRAA